MPKEHIILYKQLESEIQIEYNEWSLPPLNVDKWFTKASNTLKKGLKHQREYNGNKTPYKLSKSIETKLLSERRLIFCLWCDKWYPGMKLDSDIAYISWKRFLIVNNKRFIPEYNLKSIFLWYSLEENLINHTDYQKIYKDNGESLSELIKNSTQLFRTKSSLKIRVKQKPPDNTNIEIRNNFTNRKGAKNPMEVLIKPSGMHGLGNLKLSWNQFCSFYDDMKIILEETGALHH